MSEKQQNKSDELEASELDPKKVETKSPEKAKKEIEGANKEIDKNLKKNEEIKSISKNIKTIDGKEVSMEKIKLMETEELLKMKASDRLNLVTKWNEKLDANNLKEWKELTIDFSDNWKLVADVWVEDLFDINISSVLINWKEFTRDSLTWAFKDEKWNRGTILNWDKVKINSLRDATEVQKIGAKITKDYYDILKHQKLDEKTEKNKYKIEIIRESLIKWLKEDEIKSIFDWNIDELTKIDPLSRRKEIMKNLIYLRNKWLLKNEKFVGEIDKYADEKRERLNEQLNSKKWEIDPNTPWYSKNKNGSVTSDSPNMSWWVNKSSYNWRTYENSMSVWPNVDTSEINNQIWNLGKVNNPEWSKDELVAKWVSEHNAEIIAKRIPKEWFNVAIEFAKKEWIIKDNKPIALASVSKKMWMISYPGWWAEQFSIITANKWKGKTDMLGVVSHFEGWKISWKWRDASKTWSTTVLWAAAYSPEWGVNWWKWWHWVNDDRVWRWTTFWCVWVKQEVAIRLVQSIQKSGGGYWYEVG